MIRRGVLQAGGGSTRFGTDKALAVFGGKTMLERTAELLAGVCDEVCIVAPAEKYPSASWPVIRDRWPGQGPLGGILTALIQISQSMAANEGQIASSESRPSWALMLSCDMPFLTHEFLTFLWSRSSLSSAQVIVPESDNGLEPLCACWRSDSITKVQGAFDSGVRKVTEAMKRVPMEVLDESAWKRFDTHNRLFWNMNTPEDYEEARRILTTENR